MTRIALRRLAWCWACVVCACSIGCSQRTLAPAVEYDREQVEWLREQLQSMEWD